MKKIKFTSYEEIPADDVAFVLDMADARNISSVSLDEINWYCEGENTMEYDVLENMSFMEAIWKVEDFVLDAMANGAKTEEEVLEKVALYRYPRSVVVDHDMSRHILRPDEASPWKKLPVLCLENFVRETYREFSDE